MVDLDTSPEPMSDTLFLILHFQGLRPIVTNSRPNCRLKFKILDQSDEMGSKYSHFCVVDLDPSPEPMSDTLF